MEAISTSAVTTVEDTSFVVLTDVFVSRNRSKGASIDDRSARGPEKSSGGKKGEGRNAHRTAIRRGMCGSARLFEEGLFVEQTENASEALAEREKPAAAAAAPAPAPAAGGRRRRRRRKRNDTLPILLDKGLDVHCLSFDRNIIFFCERLRRAATT